MRELIIFLLGGITFRYMVDWMDMLTQVLTNYQTLSTSKIQKEINDMSDVYEEKQPQIGFMVDSEEEYDDDEYEDKMRRRK